MGGPNEKMPIAKSWDAPAPDWMKRKVGSNATTPDTDIFSVPGLEFGGRPRDVDLSMLANRIAHVELGLPDPGKSFREIHHRRPPLSITRTKQKRSLSDQVEILRHSWPKKYKELLTLKKQRILEIKVAKSIEEKRDRLRQRARRSIAIIKSVRRHILMSPPGWTYLTGENLVHFRANAKRLTDFKVDRYFGGNRKSKVPLKKSETFYGFKFEGTHGFVATLYFSKRDPFLGISHYWAAGSSAVEQFAGTSDLPAALRFDVVSYKSAAAAKFAETLVDTMTYFLPGAAPIRAGRIILEYGRDKVFEYALEEFSKRYSIGSGGNSNPFALIALARKALKGRLKSPPRARRSFSRRGKQLGNALEDLSDDELKMLGKFSDDVDTVRLLEAPPAGLRKIGRDQRAMVIDLEKLVKSNREYFAMMERGFGLKPAQVMKISSVLSKPWSRSSSDPLVRRLAEIWEIKAREVFGDKTQRQVLMRSHTKKQQRRKFNRLRRKVFAYINRSDEAADVRKLFIERGFTLSKSRSGLPFVQLPKGKKTLPTKMGRTAKKVEMSIDHIDELLQNPGLGLEASNLRIETRRANTVLLNQLERRHGRLGSLTPSDKLVTELIETSGKGGLTTFDLSKFDKRFMSHFIED